MSNRAIDVSDARGLGKSNEIVSADRPYLQLKDLRKSYGDFRAVRGVDLDIAEGEAVVILGPSGCGKSTTLRLVAGLETPDSGSISLGGRVLADEKTAVRPEKRNMSVVFQSYALWPHMTVRQHVRFGLTLRGRQPGDLDAAIARAIDRVQLSGMENRYPHELSGGQQQRVALARATAFDPVLLLLDEPLSNLDTDLRGDMREQIRKLHRELGVTMLYVTHDQAEALSIADRIVVMRAGLIEQVGSAQDLFASPQTEYVARSLGPCNILPGTVVNRDSAEVAVRLEGDTVVTVPIERDQSDRAVGESVSFAVRPGSLRLHASEEYPDGLHTVIDEVLFYGENTNYVSTTVQGTRLKVAAAGPPQFRRGQSVHVSIDRQAVSLVRPEPTATPNQKKELA